MAWKDLTPKTYLDFDRSTVSAAQPATMLLEVVRQLGWQMPNTSAALATLRERIREEMESTVQGSEAKSTIAAEPSGTPGAQESFSVKLPRELIGPSLLHGYLGELNQWLGAGASKERLLLVLDTFEEAQVLGDEAVDRVAAFLTAVQERVPDIRVIIVGRDEATGWFADAERMRLTELKDQASRRAFLEVRGVPRSLSAEVAKTAGGRPLALILAARLVNEHGIEAIKLSIGDRFKGLFNERLIEGIAVCHSGSDK